MRTTTPPRWSSWTLALAATLGASAGPATAAAGDPAGPEFRVNLATAGDQRRPVVAMDARGRFAVAFQTDDGPGAVRRFAANGAPLGPEVPLAFLPSAIAIDDDGDFAVVGADFESGTIVLQCFDARGNARARPAPVHPDRPAPEFGPVPATVAMDADGDLVVAWQTLRVVLVDNNGYDYDHVGLQEDVRSVYARRYDALCTPKDGPRRVTTAIQQRIFTGGLPSLRPTGRKVFAPAVAAAPDGQFVIGWSSCSSGRDADACSVYARPYAASGLPLGPPVRLSPVDLPALGAEDDVPLITMAPDGGFVAVLHGSRGRRFSALGLPQGAAFPLVSPRATGDGASVHVSGLAIDGTGRFVVASRVNGGPHGAGDVLVRRFAADGTPEAPESIANTFRPLRQDRPAAAMAADGRFVVVWDSVDVSGTRPAGQDGSGAGVYGQRFTGP